MEKVLEKEKGGCGKRGRENSSDLGEFIVIDGVLGEIIIDTFGQNM